MKLHTGDTVVVITGKDKGKTGTVLRVLHEENRVIVGSINMRTRHIKKTPQQAGRKLQFEASIHASNVMLVDAKTSKRSRIGYQVLENGNKKRISKRSGEEVKKAVAKAQKKAEKKGTKETDPKKKEEKAVTKPETATPSKKQPFWKKMSFGSAALQDAQMPEESNMEKDHSIPGQQIHVRKGGRGT